MSRLSRRQREVLYIIYECVNAITGMTPTNPAGVKCKLFYHDEINKAAFPLMLAISQFGFGELDFAKESAEEARLILETARNLPQDSLDNK